MLSGLFGNEGVRLDLGHVPNARLRGSYEKEWAVHGRLGGSRYCSDLPDMDWCQRDHGLLHDAGRVDRESWRGSDVP